MIREKWLEKQQRIYLKGLSKNKRKALQRVIDEDSEMPGDLTISIWDRFKAGSELFVAAMKGEL